jgi:hypothetical protein
LNAGQRLIVANGSKASAGQTVKVQAANAAAAAADPATATPGTK